MPPKASTTNEIEASSSENVPVTAAAIANSKDTTPDASLISASPERSDFWRLESETSLPSAATATASVGPRAAPKAKAAASGMEGTIQFRIKPTTSTVRNTRPMARDTTAPLFSQSPCLSAWRDSSKRSGAIKSSRNSSGSEKIWVVSAEIRKLATAPKAICTSGMETRGSTWSKILEIITQLSSSKISSNASMKFLSGGAGARG